VDVGEDLEEGVVAEVVGVVVVGVAGEQGVDLLGKEGLDGVVDVLGGARVGELSGEVSDDAQGPLQGPHGEQPGVGDEAAAVKGNLELLRSEVPQGKVSVRFRDHEREPPHESKLFVTHSLDSARGSPFKGSVRNPG